ncbi:PA4642 family protein [Pseudomonas sp. URMO17WK12:I11]|uniref:PA4642 family protein n=1 Tax=Pseudomonas sp. URMO17WK12:I11 TaxID=1283291 RepID=UPI0018D791DE|nr:PA4642 family protein [Pseudomonas sp. URMO17WK12:I11]MBH3364869.1 PA4642 family protein [Pseudomonas sp. URMO17WK12:I11]
MRKDKKQVIGDEISDDYIKTFLQFEPADEVTSPSLHKLVKAYRGLRVDDFRRFVGFFVEAGLDLDGKDEHGKTFAEQIADQRNGEEYIEIIENARSRA